MRSGVLSCMRHLSRPCRAKAPLSQQWTLSRWHASSRVAAHHDTANPLSSTIGSPSPLSPPTSPPKKRGRPRKVPPPPTDPFLALRTPTDKHTTLATFEHHALATGLSRTSTVYIGTRYEYLVLTSLSRLGFTLSRIGGASDLGIDLVGRWAVPTPTTPDTVTQLNVLVQCKALTPTPQHVREMEGGLLGAPPGWRGKGTVAWLAAKGDATRGVREALQRSRVAMGFVGVEGEGRVVQMLWNAAAGESLVGLGVGTRFGADGGEEVVLTFEGRRWKG
ncbi:hypothetical protein K461DRAFT_277365 [Myriangium duriaei CBS 260.36]|uniref:Restriction endonuclease type IV Mrr domain-containing protein n=1 Tax=Myriangium duriaei CBS 260.36 TaxID=1168546 RepID=A0A9P4J6T2_9PEZI|nr:hypothetical protein K461DRAFT_277365 [Myriangium duriaei CBS 260.36]